MGDSVDLFVIGAGVNGAGIGRDHRPFTAEFNADGRIQAEPLLAAFREGGGADNEICLELAFKEREPSDRQVIDQIAESVAFRRPYIDTGEADLHRAAGRKKAG